MTQEEKAIRYDEVIKRANSLLSGNQLGNAWIYKLLPELKESEGEKVRKDLTEWFEEFPDMIWRGHYKKDVIAWLEKQCEQKSTEWHSEDEQNLNACLGFIPDEFLRRWLKDAVHVKYDKGADKVEPNFHEGDMIIHKELGGDYIHNPHKIIQVDILDKKYRLEGGLVAHFGEQDDYELVDQKPSWSEEDERIYKVVLELIDSYSKGTIGSCIIPPNVERYAKWFKALKDRVQQKQEWSEEDIIIKKNIIEYIASSDIDSMAKDSWISWLKYSNLHKGCINFRNGRCEAGGVSQSTWKPSDEQMNTLEQWLKDNQYKGDARYCYPIFESLYQDLKKLKEK